MRLALVGDKRTAPSPGLIGLCPACGSSMLPKCGKQRVHHWAHWGERVCDHWWEPETEWHRNWKDKFPLAWQEIVRFDASGEKHIADVQTELGLTIEFQYSRLDPEERAAREKFHKNMIWIVNGTRLADDLPRFVEGMRSFIPIWRRGVYVTPVPQKVFPRAWLTSAVPVFFDFANASGLDESTMKISRPLWCLLPGRAVGFAVAIRVSRQALIDAVHKKAQPLTVRAFIENVSKELAALVKLLEQENVARVRAAEMPLYRRGWPPFRAPRRYANSSRPTRLLRFWPRCGQTSILTQNSDTQPSVRGSTYSAITS